MTNPSTQPLRKAGGVSNPMRWDCRLRGCFNVKKRPKIEMFAPWLPEETSFTDVDGLHEYRGRFILIEWKASPGAYVQPDRIGNGQMRTYKSLTRRLWDDALVLVIAGDAETMSIDWVQRVLRGGSTGWDRSSFEDVCERIRSFWQDGRT